jgi:hypothetical protein
MERRKRKQLESNGLAMNTNDSGGKKKDNEKKDRNGLDKENEESKLLEKREEI